MPVCSVPNDPDRRKSRTGRSLTSHSWNKQRYAEDPEYREKRRVEHRAYRARNREKINARQRHRAETDPDYRARRRAAAYGLSLQEFKALLARQESACAICKTSGRFLHVDHCHATGKVRGFLCNRCNIGLGYYDDDPDLMEAATAYLRAARGS